MEIIEIPYQKIEPSTLKSLIEEFVSRDGTDYGHEEFSLGEKVREVTELLRSGKAKLMFNSQSESCSVELNP